LKLNDAHLLLVYADVLMLLTYRVKTYIKKNTKALVILSNRIGIHVNAEKTKYVLVPRDYQNITA